MMAYSILSPHDHYEPHLWTIERRAKLTIRFARDFGLVPHMGSENEITKSLVVPAQRRRLQ
jgi:hypothetical protein